MSFSQSKIRFAAASLVLTVVVAALLAADEPKAPSADAAARDSAVLQVVFDDMLSKDNTESAPEWRNNSSAPLFVHKFAPDRPIGADQVLTRHDEKKWKALTAAQLQATKEAADDLSARIGKEKPLPELKSTSGRVKVFEDAGPATQPTRENPFPERASRVYLPGYAKDGQFAVVHIGFPWSGMMHSGVVTYILERTDTGWKVVLRDFVFYV